MMFVLDTNTLIYFFKGKGPVADRLRRCAPRDIGVPAIVLFELEYGMCFSTAPEKRLAQLQRLLAVVTVLPFEGREAQHAARIRASLEQAGTPIGPYDLLGAATALAKGGVILSHRPRFFLVCCSVTRNSGWTE